MASYSSEASKPVASLASLARKTRIPFGRMEPMFKRSGGGGGGRRGEKREGGIGGERFRRGGLIKAAPLDLIPRIGGDFL